MRIMGKLQKMKVSIEFNNIGLFVNYMEVKNKIWY